MTDSEKNAFLRAYATGDLSWASLRSRGIDNYRDVLAGDCQEFRVWGRVH
jgi:hypothetical protein